MAGRREAGGRSAGCHGAARGRGSPRAQSGNRRVRSGTPRRRGAPARAGRAVSAKAAATPTRGHRGAVRHHSDGQPSRQRRHDASRKPSSPAWMPTAAPPCPRQRFPVGGLQTGPGRVADSGTGHQHHIAGRLSGSPSVELPHPPLGPGTPRRYTDPTASDHPQAAAGTRSVAGYGTVNGDTFPPPIEHQEIAGDCAGAARHDFAELRRSAEASGPGQPLPVRPRADGVHGGVAGQERRARRGCSCVPENRASASAGAGWAERCASREKVLQVVESSRFYSSRHEGDPLLLGAGQITACSFPGQGRPPPLAGRVAPSPTPTWSFPVAWTAAKTLRPLPGNGLFSGPGRSVGNRRTGDRTAAPETSEESGQTQPEGKARVPGCLESRRFLGPRLPSDGGPDWGRAPRFTGPTPSRTFS